MNFGSGRFLSMLFQDFASKTNTNVQIIEER
jgi:hypothetical protein